uniref:hypothetical protein n=1 Tax=Burkholderia arboris TaxID=488730 RepID=UPI003BEF25F5
MTDATLPVTPDAQRVLDAMEPGRIYEPARIAQRLKISTALTRATMDGLVRAGKLKRGMFRNHYGGQRSCYFVEGVPLSGYAQQMQVHEIRAADVLDSMKAGIGYRVQDIAKRHQCPIHRASTLLVALVREKKVVKKDGGDTRKRHDLYYIAGTEPGAAPAKQAAAPAVMPLAERPTYDSEYAKSLRQFRDLATAGRGRS